MRAQAFVCQRRRELRLNKQRDRDHRKRHDADPVLSDRRQLLGAAGVGTATGGELPALPDNVAAVAAA